MRQLDLYNIAVKDAKKRLNTIIENIWKSRMDFLGISDISIHQSSVHQSNNSFNPILPSFYQENEIQKWLMLFLRLIYLHSYLAFSFLYTSYQIIYIYLCLLLLAAFLGLFMMFVLFQRFANLIVDILAWFNAQIYRLSRAWTYWWRTTIKWDKWQRKEICMLDCDRAVFPVKLGKISWRCLPHPNWP